jgi:hypothetical protein
MARPTFEQFWIPRIGEQATAQLRRSSYAWLVGGSAFAGLSIASSFAFGRGTTSGLVLGLAEVIGAIAAFAFAIRSRMKFAAAVSRWYGVKIGWYEMPRMQPASYDAWQQRRGLAPPG